MPERRLVITAKRDNMALKERERESKLTNLFD
jgi:hypothetical protein